MTNTDQLVSDWLMENQGIRFRDLCESMQDMHRAEYARRHVVVGTQDPKRTLNQRLLTLLSSALEGLILRTGRNEHSIHKAMNLIRTSEKIDEHATRDGMLRVVESGRDCDGVEYDGRVHTCEATLDGFEKLHDEIGEWADGPFRLDIVAWDEDVEYTTRDLVMEAHENGHRHSIVSRFP